MHENHHQRRGNPRRSATRSASLRCGGMIVAIATLCSAGCVADAIRSTWQPYAAAKKRTEIKVRATKEARRNWEQSYQSSYASSPCASDAEAGYIAAYVDTAMGMGECPPPVPARRLLSAHAIHQTYPAAVPWYQGYNFGHVDAVARGVDRWRLAPLNPELALALCGCRREAQTTSPEPTETFELLPQEPLQPEPEVELDMQMLPAPETPEADTNDLI
ncbi:hypothetical protein Mal15_59270 [Stieleria maiorica]|uniref:Uncharacterized protein n=1 Tax=Stieleria maiorica TaxID=2795974 RepID=A0A5B9MQ50_9BACT|nr:hypothetical protein [Stieleria maiorica]QEG01846.1 hypothetical protein Mal15_59270 [Stieleria maiorica]